MRPTAWFSFAHKAHKLRNHVYKNQLNLLPRFSQTSGKCLYKWHHSTQAPHHTPHTYVYISLYIYLCLFTYKAETLKQWPPTQKLSSLRRPFKPLLVLPIEQKTTVINASVLGTKCLFAQLHWSSEQPAWGPTAPLGVLWQPPCSQDTPAMLSSPQTLAPLSCSPETAVAAFPQLLQHQKKSSSTREEGQTVTMYCALVSWTVQLSSGVTDVSTTSIHPGFISSR